MSNKNPNIVNKTPEKRLIKQNSTTNTIRSKSSPRKQPNSITSNARNSNYQDKFAAKYFPLII